jgi:hypothetical protein
MCAFKSGRQSHKSNLTRRGGDQKSLEHAHISLVAQKVDAIPLCSISPAREPLEIIGKRSTHRRSKICTRRPLLLIKRQTDLAESNWAARNLQVRSQLHPVHIISGGAQVQSSKSEI